MATGTAQSRHACSRGWTGMCTHGLRRMLPTRCVRTDVPLQPHDKVFEWTAGNGVSVMLCGVDHLATGADLVATETGLSPNFAAATGNTLTAEAGAAGEGDALFLRLFFAVAAALTKEAHPSGSRAWREAQSRLSREQLAVVAALAAGSRLVYADRPKAVTYARLVALCSAADLDSAYGRRSIANYAAALGRAPRGSNASPSCMVERVLMHEREAVLCDSVARAADDAGREGNGSVVALVGAAHAERMHDMLQSGVWRTSQAAAQTDDWRASICAAPPQDLMTEVSQDGVRRALAESVVGLRSSSVVVNDMVRTLGGVPDAQSEAYEATREIYGTPRMLLAPLDRELLAQVVCGCRGIDMWDTLSDVRSLRPSNGGPGWSRDVLGKLRELNFELG